MSQTEQHVQQARPTPRRRIMQGTVAASINKADLTREENPRTRRYAVNPAARYLELHPTLTGRQEALIPYGEIIPFNTFPDMHTRNWSVDPEDKSPDYVLTDLTAKEAVDNVRRAAWEGSKDMGFRELPALTAVEDERAVEDIVNAVFPVMLSAPDAPNACPYDRDNTVELQDGTPEVRCLTCRLAWLESTFCEADAREAGPAAVELRRQLLDAYRTAKKFFAQTWSEWKAEMGKRDKGEMGLGVLKEPHLFVMRQLHEVDPDMRQAQAISDAQAKQGDALKEGIKEGIKELAVALRPETPAAPAGSYEELKRQLLADPDVRAQLAAEVKEREKQPAKPGGAR